jgi:hypothetical protein
MYLLLNPKNLVTALLLGSAMIGAQGASSLSKSGTEYRVLPALAGDQVQSQLALGANGGFLVTQDNSIDGSGLGIRARKFFPDLSAAQNTFQVNARSAGDQQNPRVALLKDGGAVFAWESSTPTGHRIYLRFIDGQDLLSGDDIEGSRFKAGSQSDPSLAVLANGNVIVVWAEQDRDGSMDGIFGQILTPGGVKVGNTFQVNQKWQLSQRTPSVAALEDGKFVVAWITDENRPGDKFGDTIDIYARLFNADGTEAGTEFPANTWKSHIVQNEVVELHEVCANPFVAAVPGGFRAAWSERLAATTVDSWDVKTRTFDLSGEPTSEELVVNTTTKGDQFSPRIAALNGIQLIVWTSYGQDGADEGIYARVINADGAFDGSEFLVNTRTISKQISPTVTGAGSDRFIVAWSSFNRSGGIGNYDLFAQNYVLTGSSELSTPTAPFVSALSQNSICVTWGERASEPGSSYLVYVDNETLPTETTEPMLSLTRVAWAAGSSHEVRMAYRTGTGQTSPKSDAATVKTWGADLNNDGLPDDWQQMNFGKLRPGAKEDTDGDGASNYDEFLAGTDPTDPASVLRTQISDREQGLYIEWNTIPGNFYQLQVTPDFSSWTSVGTPRFAHSTTDSLPCSGPGQVRYYRVIRMR